MVDVQAYSTEQEGRSTLQLLSGVIVDTSGLIVTSALEHVDSLRIVLADGRQVPGQLVASDSVFGLSYVQVREPVHSVAGLADRRPPIGDAVIAAGYCQIGDESGPRFFAVSQGIVSSDLTSPPSYRMMPGYWLATDIQAALGQNLLFDAAGNLLSVSAARDVRSPSAAPGTRYYPLPDVPASIHLELRQGSSKGAATVQRSASTPRVARPLHAEFFMATNARK